MTPMAAAAAAFLVAISSPAAGPQNRTFALRATLIGPHGAHGLSVGTLTPTASGATVAWRITFKALTGPAVVSEIRCGLPGRSGPVLARLCAPCRSGAHRTVRISGQPARHAILFGDTYVVVQTARYPRGEIRGQIPKVSPG
jgi:hypothetical protein